MSIHRISEAQVVPFGLGYMYGFDRGRKALLQQLRDGFSSLSSGLLGDEKQTETAIENILLESDLAPVAEPRYTEYRSSSQSEHYTEESPIEAGGSTTVPQGDKLTNELNAFRLRRSMLIRTHPSRFVAIHNGSLLDSDTNEFELAARVASIAQEEGPVAICWVGRSRDTDIGGEFRAVVDTPCIVDEDL